ncbi:hypothetical protein O3Y_07140 [Vibrio cholerae IEC224]|nr:hypothetical protein O3Y_07140 [Vibrio cholerae IEC224]
MLTLHLLSNLYAKALGSFWIDNLSSYVMLIRTKIYITILIVIAVLAAHIIHSLHSQKRQICLPLQRQKHLFKHLSCLILSIGIPPLLDVFKMDKH